ncbi:MAG: large conductance mechanosensitive channel protein MscL [Saprospiraceae bacterium]|nr:large conductance mechanosensitive channel protein MscL [Saprospiraceae bacterium]
MLKEFKEFAMKGNMLDLAIGFILGAAFGTIVKSLVDDILMPIVASVLGSPDFSNLFVVLKEPADMTDVNMASIASIREAGGIALGYGLFLNALISFLIMAFILFMIVKNVNKLKKKEEDVPAPPAGPTQEELLMEIRDLLKK